MLEISLAFWKMLSEQPIQTENHLHLTNCEKIYETSAQLMFAFESEYLTISTEPADSTVRCRYILILYMLNFSQGT